MKAHLLLVLMTWLTPPDNAVETDSDMSIDQQIIAAYDSLPQTTRLNNTNYVRVELDMLFRLDEWENLMREEGRLYKRKRRKAERNLERLWPNAVIPYELFATFNENDVRAIHSAMNDYQQYTCIRFREKTYNDKEYVKFVDYNGCNSFVGRLKNESGQELSLALKCRNKPVILHELGHAIGLMHEHSRPDRDDFIIINETNLPRELVGDMSRLNFMAMDTWGIPYDYLSIMHYSEDVGSNRTIVITTRDPRYQKAIGKQKGLSFRDVKLINLMYRCFEQNQCRWRFCPGEGFVGQDCQCWCPSTNNVTVIVRCPRHEGVTKMELNFTRAEQRLLRQISVIEVIKNRTSLDQANYWPNATVPYVNHAMLSIHDRAMLHTALLNFHAYTCIRFRERMIAEDDYLKLQLAEECASFQGRIGGMQSIFLSSSCKRGLSGLIRLLSYAVGFGPEHNRPDRNNYITIVLSNIDRNMVHNFQIQNNSEMYTDQPYDYRSITHYSELAFSTNRQPTIVAKNASYQHLMGTSTGFTFGDVKRLNMMYRCAERRNCSQFIRCPGNGFVGQDCKCWCPRPGSNRPVMHCTDCTDFEQMCALWSEYGFCTSREFKNYMTYTCPRSCRLCSPNTSSNQVVETLENIRLFQAYLRQLSES